MVSVGGMFRGGVVESIVVKATYDDSGVRTGTQKTMKVLSGINSSIRKQRTYVKENDDVWRKTAASLSKNLAYYKKIEAFQRKSLELAKKKKNFLDKQKMDMIRAFPKADMVLDSKGRRTAGTKLTTFSEDFLGLNKFQKQITGSTSTSRALGRGLEEVTTKFTNFEGKVIKTTKEIKQQRSQFQMWALSFLFAGMQIKRTAEMITRSSVGTFMKITRGQTEAGRSIIGLAANFKFLQFSIGQAIGTALKPLMPILTNLIRGVAQFVQQHPEATFAAIAGAFVLGTGLFLGGQMVLFANGVIELVKHAGGLDGIATSLGKVKDNFIPLAKKAAGGVLIAIGLQDLTEGISEEDFQKTMEGGLETLAGGLFLMGKSKAGVLTLVALLAFKVVVDDEFRQSAAKFIAGLTRLLYAAGGLLIDFIKHIIAKPLELLNEGLALLKDGDFKGAAMKFGLATLAAIPAIEGNMGFDGRAPFKKHFDAFDMEGATQASLDIMRGASNLVTTGSIAGETSTDQSTTINANVVNINNGFSSSGTDFTDINAINRMT